MLMYSFKIRVLILFILLVLLAVALFSRIGIQQYFNKPAPETVRSTNPTDSNEQSANFQYNQQDKNFGEEINDILASMSSNRSKIVENMQELGNAIGINEGTYTTAILNTTKTLIDTRVKALDANGELALALSSKKTELDQLLEKSEDELDLAGMNSEQLKATHNKITALQEGVKMASLLSARALHEFDDLVLYSVIGPFSRFMDSFEYTYKITLRSAFAVQAEAQENQ